MTNVPMPDTPVASVIILGWNGIEYVDDCLTSVLDQDVEWPYEVLFIDNGSRDGTADRAQSYAGVKVHQLDRNYGYCIGNNIGFSLSRGRYIVFLNQDVVVHRSWLRELVSAVESDESVVAAHANIIQPWYPEFRSLERRAPVDAAYTADLSPLGFIAHRRVAPDQRVHDTTFLHGVSIVIRRDFVESTGYAFDPDMFAYAEDLDMGLRVNAAGYRTVVATRAVLYHKHTLDTRLSFATLTKTVRIIRNRLLSMWKCSTWAEFLPLAAVTVACSPLNAREFGASPARRVLHFFLLMPPSFLAVFATAFSMPRYAERRRKVLATRRAPSWWLFRRLYLKRTKAISPIPAET